MSLWIRRNAVWIFILLVVIFAGALVWFIFAGSSRDPVWIMIGVAALSAFFSAVSAVATWVQAAEAQKQREKSEQPNVMVYFDTTWTGLFNLIVTNTGNAPATDVQIRFEPGFKVHTGESVNDWSLFQHPISFLPPGMIYRQFINASYRFLEEDNPLRFKVHIEYKTALEKPDSKSLDFDLNYLRDTHSPDKPTEAHLADISEELKILRINLETVIDNRSIRVRQPDENDQWLPETLE